MISSTCPTSSREGGVWICANHLFEHSSWTVYAVIIYLNIDLTVVMAGKRLVERFIEVGHCGRRHQGSQKAGTRPLERENSTTK